MLDPNPASRVAWFQGARFGLFIHFGLYSIPAGAWKGRRIQRNDYAEWIRYQANWPDGPLAQAEYDQLLAQFNPHCFDADAWVCLAKKAGMRYLVVTTKHHDGFALWDSRVSDYNVVKATPFARDIIRELVSACREHGLKVGLYYSHWQDWEYPGGGLPPWPEGEGDPVVVQPSEQAFDKYWNEKCLPQVRELLELFHPDLLWFDSWGQKRGDQLSEVRLAKLIDLIRSMEPACLINSRIGTDVGIDYLSMGDNEFPQAAQPLAWETSGTMNSSWGYNALDVGFHDADTLLRHLIDNASRGGNYQLNIGPTGDGSLQPEVLQTFQQLSEWMQENGIGIHGGRPAPVPEPSWGRLISHDGSAGSRRLYAFVYNSRKSETYEVAGFSEMPVKGWMLKGGAPVRIDQTEHGFSFTLPIDIKDGQLGVVAFEWIAP